MGAMFCTMARIGASRIAAIGSVPWIPHQSLWQGKGKHALLGLLTMSHTMDDRVGQPHSFMLSPLQSLKWAREGEAGAADGAIDDASHAGCQVRGPTQLHAEPRSEPGLGKGEGSRSCRLGNDSTWWMPGWVTHRASCRADVRA